MPADLFPMIEVVRAERTEDSAVDLAVSAIEQAGREPILLQRAVNGYLINRLQHSILHEAYHLIEDGIVTAEMVDKVAKRLLGPRMCITGLLEQKDLAGLVMHAQAQRSIVPSLSHTGIPPPSCRTWSLAATSGFAAEEASMTGRDGTPRSYKAWPTNGCSACSPSWTQTVATNCLEHFSQCRSVRLPPSRKASADRRSLGGGGQADRGGSGSSRT